MNSRIAQDEQRVRTAQITTRKGFSPANAEWQLKERGIGLPVPQELFGTYVEAVQTGNLLFLAAYGRPPGKVCWASLGGARPGNRPRDGQPRDAQRPSGRKGAFGTEFDRADIVGKTSLRTAHPTV